MFVFPIHDIGMVDSVIAKNTNKYVGQKIREYRGRVSQRDFAPRIGISHGALNQIETAVTRCSVGRLVHIALELGRPVTDFLPPKTLEQPGRNAENQR